MKSSRRFGAPAQFAERAPRRARHGVHAVDGLGQPEPREQRRDDGDRRGGPDRRGVADVREEAAEAGADDEAEPERRAEHPERLGAVLLGRDVADVGARGRDVAARQAVDDARGEEHREAVRHRQHHEADDRADQAENQHGPPAPLVRPGAEHRRREELRRRRTRRRAGRSSAATRRTSRRRTAAAE